MCVFFFFKQKTAYEMRISDWSSDVCSSDLAAHVAHGAERHVGEELDHAGALEKAAEEDEQEDVGGRHVGWNAVDSLRPDEQMIDHLIERSEERRVGKECVSTCRSRWSPYH